MRHPPAPLAALLFIFSAAFAVAQDYDLVIRKGRLIDGTGKPSLVGDIAVRGDRIAAIGKFDGKGRNEIDAAGRAVAPGFIDVHTHSEDMTSLPVGENFLRMG